jgi:hypothetical protein
MFKNTARMTSGTPADASRPARLEEMIVYAKFALQNVGGPGYDPYNSPAASGRRSLESAVTGASHPPSGY